MTADETAIEALATALAEADQGPLAHVDDYNRWHDTARALWATLRPLAVAGEREACAKLAESMNSHGRFIAAAIRERGQA